MKKEKCKGKNSFSNENNLLGKLYPESVTHKVRTDSGITLIALVITVIVLLILAGVALKLVTGGDGILGKAEKAVNLTNEAMAKEKLELKMAEYMADKIDNPDLSLKDYLKDVEGCTGVVEDEAEDNPGGYIVTIDGFGFRVSPKGEVLGRAEKLTSPQISITQSGSKVEVTMTQRGEEIVNLEILNSDGNVLTNIPKENMTLIEGKYVIEYTFANQGSYSVVVTTANGEEYTKEVVIDLNPPADPVITSNYGYPILTKTGIKLDGTTKIEYDTTSETENFYSLDGTNWQKYTGEFQATAGTVYAKSVKKSNGLESTANKPIGIPSDALPPGCYTNSDDIASVYSGTKDFYLNIENSVIGKNFSFDYTTMWNVPNVSWINVSFYNQLGDVISTSGNYASTGRTTQTLAIPEGTVKVGFKCYANGTNYTTKIYKVTLRNEPVISSESIYPRLTQNGIEKGYTNARISYFPTSVQKLYSLDGTNWEKYENNSIRVEYGTTIYAKGIDENGIETEMVSLTSSVPDDALPVVCYDNDSETATSVNGATKNFYINVDGSVIGKSFSFVYATKWGATSVNWLNIEFCNELGEVINNTEYYANATKTTVTLTIPENTMKINFKCYANPYYITKLYEVNSYGS